MRITKTNLLKNKYKYKLFKLNIIRKCHIKYSAYNHKLDIKSVSTEHYIKMYFIDKLYIKTHL